MLSSRIFPVSFHTDVAGGNLSTLAFLWPGPSCGRRLGTALWLSVSWDLSSPAAVLVAMVAVVVLLVPVAVVVVVAVVVLLVLVAVVTVVLLMLVAVMAVVVLLVVLVDLLMRATKTCSLWSHVAVVVDTCRTAEW